MPFSELEAILKNPFRYILLSSVSKSEGQKQKEYRRYGPATAKIISEGRIVSKLFYGSKERSWFVAIQDTGLNTLITLKYPLRHTNPEHITLYKLKRAFVAAKRFENQTARQR